MPMMVRRELSSTLGFLGDKRVFEPLILKCVALFYMGSESASLAPPMNTFGVSQRCCRFHMYSLEHRRRLFLHGLLNQVKGIVAKAQPTTNSENLPELSNKWHSSVGPL